MKQLGKLEKIEDLRSIWKHEAKDFTPWLAEEENLAMLSEAIGIDIVLEEQESNVGEFSVAIFIRSMVGVDRQNAMKRFSDFISGNELNAEQEDFLNTIISYVSENGDITKEIVVNEAPFDERLSVFTPYMLPLAKYVDTLHNVVWPMTA